MTSKIKLALAVALTLSACSGLSRVRSAKPDIILVVGDDQEVASVAKAMPKLTALWASSGVTFANSVVCDPLCCPSRAGCLTGQLNHNNGVWDVRPPLHYQVLDYSTTLPTWLKTAGYRTAYFGKFLNGYGEVLAQGQTGVPCRVIPAGWDRWFVWLDPPGYKNFVVNDQGIIRKYGNGVPPSGCSIDESTVNAYATDLQFQQAAAWIAAQPLSDPLFVVIAPGAPHEWGTPPADTSPLPAQRHMTAFPNEPLPQGPAFNESDVGDKPAFVQALPTWTASQIATLTNIYRNRLRALLAVDDGVETIENALVASGRSANAVRIYTADNGWTVDHRIPWRKFAIYRDSTEVPLIVRGPGYPVQVRQELVSNVDLAATIAALAGATPTRIQDGADLTPLLLGQAPQWRSAALIASRARTTYDAVRTAAGIVYVKHTLTGEEELYDLAVDPSELVSKHDDPAYASIKADVIAKLAALTVCAGASCWIN